MKHKRIHNTKQLRTLLIEYEESRYKEYEQKHFWNRETQFRRLTKQLAQLEHASDAHFKQQIEEARQHSKLIALLETQWSVCIQDDIKWYEEHLKVLQRNYTDWQHIAVGQQAWKDLTNDIRYVAQHRLARHIAFNQLAIDMLERQRQHHGAIDRNLWYKHWEQLLNAYANQDATGRGVRLSHMARQRLAWAQRLQRQQRQSEQRWRHQPNADLHGLRADMTTVHALLKDTRPNTALSRISSVLSKAATLAVVVVAASALGSILKPDDQTQSAKARILTHQLGIIPTQEQDVLNQSGVHLLKQGNYADAVPQFQAAFAIDPHAESAYQSLNNLAFCFYELNQHEEAIAKWQYALEMKHDNPDTNAGLGFALYNRGQQHEGLALYRRAVELQVGYADETYLRETAFWSEDTIEASRSLREAIMLQQ